jgi:hypothetical protein
LNRTTPAQSSLPPHVLPAALGWAEEAGASVIPIKADGSKSPALKTWKPYQTRAADREQIEAWFTKPRYGLGVVMGYGNVELLDFDEVAAWRAYRKAARKLGLRKLLDRVIAGYSERSPKGQHLIWRCEAVGPSTKLAQRFAEPEEWTAEERERVEAKPLFRPVRPLIETKGQGGYGIVAPSGGTVHPSGKPYVLGSGGPDKVAPITPEEREALLTLARTFDRTPPKPATPPRAAQPADGTRPGDAYNVRGPQWAEILEPHGWSYQSTSAGLDYWCRPGKRSGVSATTGVRGDDGDDLLCVFSTSTPFRTVTEGFTYTKFGAYTMLYQGEDYATAAKVLRAAGYGAEEGDSPYSLLGTILSRSELAKLPKPEPLIEGWLDLRTMAVMIGDTGTSKTFTALGWAASVATGVDWLGYSVCCGPFPVIYVVGEGAGGLDDRLAAWEAAHNFGRPIPDGQLIILRQPASMTNEKFWKQLTALAIERGARLLIFDTFSSLAPDADETTDAAPTVRSLGDLATTVDGTTVLVHHTGWAEKRRARGGSQFEANPDSTILLERYNSDDPESPVSIFRKKDKDGPAGAQVWVERVPSGASCVLKEISAPVRSDGRRGLSNREIQDEILLWIVNNEPTTKTKIRNSVRGKLNIGVDKFNVAFGGIEDEGSIVSTPKEGVENGRKRTRDVWTIAGATSDRSRSPVSDEGD